MTTVQVYEQKRPILVKIPFITTTFATNVYLYALLWPVWWAFGIEQLLLPFFAGFEAVRYLFRSRWRFGFNTTVLLTLLLAMWWLVPLIWVDREQLDIFLKDSATVWSQALLLFLFWNSLKTEKEWHTIVRALEIIALYTALGGLIFLGGLWQGEFLSGVGRLLPSGLVESSAFFSSIAYRAFGAAAIEEAIFAKRVSSFSLNFSGLSMICLLLWPFMFWRFLRTPGLGRIKNGFIIIGLLICLVFTESRMAYIALLAGLSLFFALWFDLLRGNNRLLSLAMGLIAAALGIAFAYLAFQVISELFRAFFLEWRPASWLSRFNIYLETFRLLPEHPIAGWGASVKREGASSTYSIGTHSSYLAVLFQHGIVGLLLYLSIWLSIWRVIIRALRQPARTPILASFWMMIAVAFFSFNVREAADSWWWDQLTTFTVWLSWGLVLTAPRIFQQNDHSHESRSNTV